MHLQILQNMASWATGMAYRNTQIGSMGKLIHLQKIGFDNDALLYLAWKYSSPSAQLFHCMYARGEILHLIASRVIIGHVSLGIGQSDLL